MWDNLGASGMWEVARSGQGGFFMGGIDLTPRILADEEAGLVVEESRFGRVGVWISGLFLASLVVVPAAAGGSLEMLLVGLVLGGIVVGVPFLIVLWLSRYRRLEVRKGSELVSTSLYRLRRPQTVRIGWNEVARVVCERRTDRRGRPGRMLVMVETVGGKQHQVLSGWFSEEVRRSLARHLSNRFDYVEKGSFST